MTSSKSTLIKLILVTVVIVGIVSAYFYFRPKTATSAQTNWKTFKKNGIVFKFPKNLEVLQNQGSYILIDPSTHNEIPYNGYEAGLPFKKTQFIVEEMSFGPTDAFKTAREFYNTLSGHRTTIGGHEAVILNQDDTFGHILTSYTTTRAYILKNDNDLISIGTVVFPEDASKADDRKELLEQILASVTFTK